jgi:hypothetical protein
MPTPHAHAKIRSLVRRIRRETGSAVPDVDPDGPGTAARVLLVARDPGEKGALVTGVLSPSKNPDATARNLLRAMEEAKLPERICVFWNAVPWALGGRRTPNREELRRGVGYLHDLVALLPNLRAVVALGRDAQTACRLAGLDAIAVCHPSPLGLYGRGANRWDELVAGLRDAAALAAKRTRTRAAPVDRQPSAARRTRPAAPRQKTVRAAHATTRTLVRDHLKAGLTPDQIYARTDRARATYLIAIEEEAALEGELGAFTPTPKTVTDLRDRRNLRWERIAARILSDAARTTDVKKRYDQARGPGAHRKSYTGRGRRFPEMT